MARQRTKKDTLSRRQVTIWAVALLLIAVSGVSGETKDSKNKVNDNGEKKPNKVISLAESITRSQKSLQDPERAKASREQWESALKEIRELALDVPKPSKRPNKGETKYPFTEWKLLLDQPSKVELNTDTSEVEDAVEPKPQTSRFEGFASWERMLQDWADDVQDYLDKIEAENSDYPMANYGQPKTKKDDTKIKLELPAESNDFSQEEIKQNINTNAADLNDNGPLNDNANEGESDMPNNKKKGKISLPLPAPAKDGEPVLSHTDIADKSKRIWIVTTAALPWMTGTAVNPLLRAAYMADGRAECGGSVTLMLPWLEREQDRDSVYGKSREFETPQEQEIFIRKWLVEKAKIPQAGETLRIEWYTSWQNKVENSLYSMGDITALIPAEDVDIMILEEPEHLNWYVGHFTIFTRCITLRLTRVIAGTELQERAGQRSSSM